MNAVAAALDSHDVLLLDSVNAALVRGTLGGPGNIYVATPALLRHYGIDPGAIAPTTDLVTSRPGLAGTSHLQLIYGNPPTSATQAPPPTHTLDDPKIQTFAGLPRGTSDPNLLITPAAAARLGLQAPPTAWLIQTSRPLTGPQIAAARQTALSANMTIEAKSDTPSLSALRTYATVGGILLALGVLAMTVGLIRAETAGDLRTLTATGASSWIRRNISGATAGLLGLLGALLGTAVAYLATVAFFRSQLSERLGQTPTLDLVLILIGLPVAATIGGWLFAGRRPPAIARRPIE